VMRAVRSFQGSRGSVSWRAAAGISALSLVTGLALASQLSGGGSVSTGSATQVEAPAEHGPGPTGIVDGIPSGFARTREGAIAAASAYVTTGQPLLDLDPLSAERAVRRLAASAHADRFATETLEQLRSARAALAEGRGPIVYRQAVVAYRVDAFDPDRARVSIWNVGVLTRDGVAPPQAAWATSTFDLVWEEGDWRIWAEAVVPGPAPILNNSAAPATTRQFMGALEGFVDFARRR
jgi:hypothetical protein